MIPKGWKAQTICNILERVNDPIIVKPDTYYQEIGIRSHGKGIFYKELAPGRKLGNKRVFNIHPNCFIVNIVFAWEQAVAKTSASECGMIASHRFPMYQPIKNMCDLDYITYFFKSKRGKYLLELASPGGAGRNKTLGQKEFSKLELLLPPIQEQKKISEILSTSDKAIELTKKLCVLYRQIFTAILESEFSSENLWDTHEITNLANNQTNSFKDGDWIESPYITRSGVRLIQTGNIGVGSFKNKNKRYISIESFKQLKCKEVHPGDILICRLADPIGRCCLLPDLGEQRYITSVDVIIFRPIESINKNFILASLNRKKIFNQAISISGGSTRQRISRTSYGKICIGIPNNLQQEKIGIIWDTFVKNELLLKNYLELLTKQKEGLMQQLMAGKIRVNI